MVNSSDCCCFMSFVVNIGEGGVDVDLGVKVVKLVFLGVGGR